MRERALGKTEHLIKKGPGLQNGDSPFDHNDLTGN